jgi:hypothetical protein
MASQSHVSGHLAREAPTRGRRSFTPIFRIGPEDFIEDAYVQLDRVLAAARVRQIRLIITLANYWGDYGGIPRYLAWAGLPDRGFGARDRFFSDERTTRDRWLGLPRSRWFARFLDRTDTDDVRGVLRAHARRRKKAPPQSRNPRLGSKVGDQPLTRLTGPCAVRLGIASTEMQRERLSTFLPMAST